MRVSQLRAGAPVGAAAAIGPGAPNHAGAPPNPGPRRREGGGGGGGGGFPYEAQPGASGEWGSGELEP
eukprot:SAG31_NODE_801_length_12013_cov_23.812070_3_plen_68_part_00